MSSAIKALFNSASPSSDSQAESSSSSCYSKTAITNSSERNAFCDLLADREKVIVPPYKVVPKKNRYKIDFPAQMAESEANYARLLKILSNFDNRDHWCFAMGRGAAHVDITITVTDRAPYTSTLKLKQQTTGQHGFNRPVNQQEDAQNERGEYLKIPTLTICLYHDAGMAEVVGWENHRRLRPRYHYPNTNMYHIDEKAQCNRYLSDWLILCLAQGRTAVEMTDLGLPAVAYK